MDKRKVVDVPSESKASPGAERETTVAELSPVNGAMIQSRTVALMKLYWKKKFDWYTWPKSPAIYPPITYSS
jgi:hypothetical protein